MPDLIGDFLRQWDLSEAEPPIRLEGGGVACNVCGSTFENIGGAINHYRRKTHFKEGRGKFPQRGGNIAEGGSSIIYWTKPELEQKVYQLTGFYDPRATKRDLVVVLRAYHTQSKKMMNNNPEARNDIRNSVIVIENLKKLAQENPEVQSLVVKMARLNDALKRVITERHQLQMKVLFYEKKGVSLNNYVGNCSEQMAQLQQRVSELEAMNKKLEAAREEHKKEGREIVMKLKNLNVVGNGAGGNGSGGDLQRLISLLGQRQELGYKHADAQATADDYGVRNFEREQKLMEEKNKLSNDVLRLEQELQKEKDRAETGSVGAQERQKQLQKEKDEAQAALKRKEDELTACKRESRKQDDAQREADELRRKLAECEAKIRQIKGESNQEIGEYTDRLRKAEEKVRKAESELKSVQEELQQCRDELGKRKQGQSAAETESQRSIRKFEERAKKAEAEAEALRDKLSQADTDCLNKMAEIWDEINKIRKDMRDKYKGIKWQSGIPPSKRRSDIIEIDVLFGDIKSQLSFLNSDIIALGNILLDRYDAATQGLTNAAQRAANTLNKSNNPNDRRTGSKLNAAVQSGDTNTIADTLSDIVNKSVSSQASWKESLEEYEQARNDLVSTQSSLTQKNRDLENQIRDVRGQLQTCENEKAALQRALDECNNKLRPTSIKSTTSSKNVPSASAVGKVSPDQALKTIVKIQEVIRPDPEDKKKINDLTTENANIKAEKERLERKVAELEEKKKDIDQRLEDLDKEEKRQRELLQKPPEPDAPQEEHENYKKLIGMWTRTYTQLKEGFIAENKRLNEEIKETNAKFTELERKEAYLRSAIQAFYEALKRKIPDDDEELVDSLMKIYDEFVNQTANEKATLEAEKKTCEERLKELNEITIPYWKEQLEEKEVELKELRPLKAQVDNLKADVEKEKTRASSAEKRAREAEGQALSAEAMKPLEEALANARTEAIKLREENKRLQSELNSLKAKATASRTAQGLQQARELDEEKNRIKNETLRKRNQEILAELFKLVQKLPIAEIKSDESVEARILKISQAIDKLGKDTTQIDTLNVQIAQLQSEKATLETEAQRQKRLANQSKDELEAKEAELKRARDELATKAGIERDELDKLNNKIAKLVSISASLAGKEGAFLDTEVNKLKQNLANYDKIVKELAAIGWSVGNVEDSYNKLKDEVKRAKNEAEAAKRDAEQVRQGALKNADQRVKQLDEQLAQVKQQLADCNQKVQAICSEIQRNYNSTNKTLQDEIDKLERKETNKKPPSREGLRGLMDDTTWSLFADRIWDTYNDIKNRGSVKSFNLTDCQENPSRSISNWGQLRALQGQFNAIKFIIEESRKSIEGSAMLQQCSLDIEKFQGKYTELANAIGWLKGIIKALERKKDNQEEYKKLIRYLKQGRGNPEWYRDRLRDIDTARKAIISNAGSIKSGITKENLLNEVEKIKAEIQIKKGMREADIKSLESKYKAFCASLNRLISEIDRTITKDFSEALLNEFEDVSGTVRVYIRLNDVFFNTSKGGKSLSSWVQTEKNGRECSRVVNFDGRIVNQGISSFGPFYGVFMCATNEDIYKGVTAGMTQDFCANKSFPNGTQNCQFTFESSKGLNAVLRQALDGYKVAVFGYGYSGSGKTYTLFGDTKKIGGAKGVIQDVFSEKSEIYQRIVKERYQVSIEGIYELYGQGMPYLTGGREPKYNVLYPVVNPIVNSGYLGKLGMDSGRTFITPPEVVDVNPPEHFPRPSMSDDYYINVVQRAKENIEGLGGRSNTLNAMVFTSRSEKITSKGGAIQRKKIMINNTSEINNVINFIINVVTLRRRLIQRIKATPNNPESSRGHLFIEIGLEKAGVMGKIVVCDLGGIENPQEILTTIFPSTTGMLQQIILRTKDVGRQIDEITQTLRGKRDMFNLQGTININDLYEKNKRIASNILSEIENPEVLTDVLIEANSFIINGLRGAIGFQERRGVVKMTNNIKKFIETYGISYDQINKLVDFYYQVFMNPRFNQDLMDSYLESKIRFALDLVKEGFYINETLNHMKTYFQFQKGIEVRLLNREAGASVSNFCSALDAGKSPNVEYSETYRQLLPPFNATDTSQRPYSPIHMFWNPVFQYTREREVRVEFCFAEKGSVPDKKTREDYVGMITALQRINFSQSDNPSKFVMLSMIRPDYDSNDLRYYYGAYATLMFADQIASTTLR